MNRPLQKIDALSEDQRLELAHLLQSHTLDQCVELVKERFGTEICRSTLNRFRKRCEHAAYIDTSPDSARARAEIINAAASGKPNFSQATVDLLEKQAFELAHETRDPEAVRALKDLFGLVLKYENTSVRKRMATVQEGKLKLRQQQFENANKDDNTEAKIRDLNERISIAFGRHPLITAIRNAESSAGRTGAPPVPAGAPPAEKASPNALTLPALHEETPSSQTSSNQPPLAPNPSEGGSKTNSRSTGSDARADLNPSLTHSPSADHSPLSSTPSLQRGEPTSSSVPPTASAVSAATHETREAPDSKCQMKNAHLVSRSERQDLGTKLEAGLGTPCSMLNEKALATWPMLNESSEQNESLISHAIRRWRAHLPRPSQPSSEPSASPQPDDSWRDECPCGKPLPCPDHPDLYFHLRSYRPQHPDFALMLKEAGIPYYIPTTQELGCSRETLAKSRDLFALNPRAPSFSVPPDSPSSPDP